MSFDDPIDASRTATARLMERPTDDDMALSFRRPDRGFTARITTYIVVARSQDEADLLRVLAYTAFVHMLHCYQVRP